MRVFKVLSDLEYKGNRLKQFLHKNTRMKVFFQVDFKIITPDEKPDDDKPIRQVIKFRNRRFEVPNTDGIPATITKMTDGIGTQIGNSYLSSSYINLDKADKITIHYDKYHPTRAGSYIELPK